MIDPHPYLGLARPDVVAETWEGVDDTLYARLWAVMADVPYSNAPEPDVNSCEEHWDKFTDAEKQQLNELAEAQEREHDNGYNAHNH